MCVCVCVKSDSFNLQFTDLFLFSLRRSLKFNKKKGVGSCISETVWICIFLQAPYSGF